MLILCEVNVSGKYRPNQELKPTFQILVCFFFNFLVRLDIFKMDCYTIQRFLSVMILGISCNKKKIIDILFKLEKFTKE